MTRTTQQYQKQIARNTANTIVAKLKKRYRSNKIKKNLHINDHCLFKKNGRVFKNGSNKISAILIGKNAIAKIEQ